MGRLDVECFADLGEGFMCQIGWARVGTERSPPHAVLAEVIALKAGSPI